LADHLRLIAASTALALPAVVFVLNALISFRERGIVEPMDIPAAIAFAVLAAMVLRGARLALFGGIALIVVYLVSAASGGVLALVAYWSFALVIALQALPLARDVGKRAAA
jgi:hypothetical protein